MGWKHQIICKLNRASCMFLPFKYYLIAILYVLHMLYILNFFCDKHPSKFRKGCWCKEAERIRMVEENFHKINSWRVDYINDWKLKFDLLRQIVSDKTFISYFDPFFKCAWKNWGTYFIKNIFCYQNCLDLKWEIFF